MEIKEMNIEQIEARFAELKAEITDELSEERCNEINAELDKLEERKAELRAEKEQRDALAEKIAKGEVGKVIKENDKKEEREEMFGVETKEYRDAFVGMLSGKATAEQRAIFADNTNYGDGMALPVGVDKEIWDQVHSAHPILADVVSLNTGIAIKVTKVTPGAVTKAKDSAARSEQTETHVEVTLVGADYPCKIKISFAESKMSQGAMEKFFISEVANAVGEALAKDVFAKILSDAGSAQKVTATTSVYKDIQSALALATGANNCVIYANNADYYKILGEVDANGQPIVRDGVALNAMIKKDNAATKITVVDPQKFVLNVVQATMVKVTEDEDFNKVISALCRAEGCLRNTKAAAYIG